MALAVAQPQRVVLLLGLFFALALAAPSEGGAAAAEPATGAFAPTGGLARAHNYQFTVTTLATGKVLVIGGQGDAVATSVELYDPLTEKWSSCPAATASAACPAPVGVERRGHAATLLKNGKLLVTGGDTGGPDLASSELYDPATGTWTSCSAQNASASCPGPMNRGRSLHSATLLGDGTVLAAGGLPLQNAPVVGPSPAADKTTERYDPETGKWTVTRGGLNTTRGGHTATLLDRGNCGNNCGGVLVAGDAFANPNQNTAELYVPSLDLWNEKNDMNQGRRDHTATLLPSGEVMVAGGARKNAGTGDTFGLTSVERWNPIPGDNFLLGEQWTTVAPLNEGRGAHTATLLPNARQVLVAGGASSVTPEGVQSAELYDIAANKWTKFTAPRFQFGGAALLPSGPLSACGTNCGKVLLTHADGSTPLEGAPGSAAWLYTAAPELAKLSPASGPETGGTAVTLEGTGLASVSSVKFGGVEATGLVPDPASPDTKLVAISPSQAAGTVPVTVVTDGGTWASGPSTQFTYAAATGGSVGGSTGAGGNLLPTTTPAPQQGGTDALAAALAAERRRLRALRGCLSFARRHTRREYALARNGSERRRTLARRHAGRHAKAVRSRCLRLHGRTPGRVTGLSARTPAPREVVLGFRAPGTDRGKPPPARSYLVKQSTRPITDLRSFRRAQTLCSGSCRLPVTRVGEELKLRITDLRPRTTYYYAVAARDNVSRRPGPRSRAVKATTR